jgi:ATP:corrinoid adenosyltransferase
MAEDTKDKDKEKDALRSKDEVALELMKFIAVTTGYGKGATTAGYGGKTGVRTSEEQAEALIQLFQRCRTVVAAPPTT